MAMKFTSHKAEVEQHIRQSVRRALEIVGGTAEGHAKENITQNRSVISGALRNSITHQQRGEDTMVVGTNIEYAPYVELGHNQQPGRYVPAIKKRLVRSFVPAKPYLRPAVENHINEYREIIRNELNV